MVVPFTVSADQPDPVAANSVAAPTVNVSPGALPPASRDLTPCSIKINGDALVVNNPSVTLSLVAPPGTTHMQFRNDGSGSFAGPPEPFAALRPNWPLTDTDGKRIVEVEFQNRGSTLVVLATCQDDVVLTRTQPTGSAAVAARSASGAVSVRLSAAAERAGVETMRLSGDPRLAGATAQPYFTSAVVNPGSRNTVYAEFRDRAGNTTQTSIKLPSLSVSPFGAPGGPLAAGWDSIPEP
jgi:hypothetical protein